MKTLLLFVYRKFLPLGSPPNTIGTPLVVLGSEAKTHPVNEKVYSKLILFSCKLDNDTY